MRSESSERATNLKPSNHVLLIEDDPLIIELLTLYFEIEGFIATGACNGLTGISEAKLGKYQLILLDLNLPDISGIEVFRKIRHFSSTPIAIISTRSDENEKLLGLELGADDYIVKPFNPREVVVRSRNIIKRSAPQATIDQENSQTKTFGNLAIDGKRYIARVFDQPISLTRAEFKLLDCLTANHGNVCTRDMLISVITDDQNHIFDRTLDRHIANIRRKLGETPTEPQYIETVIGLGYRFKSDSILKKAAT